MFAAGARYCCPVRCSTLAWVLIGLGMGTGLYDAVFAALGRMYGSEARGPITSLTLFGGFAGTICWPLSAFMIEHLGWRSACFIYAAIHLLVMLPLQVSVVRAPPKTESGAAKPAASGETEQYSVTAKDRIVVGSLQRITAGTKVEVRAPEKE